MARSGIRVYSTRQYRRDRKACLAGDPPCTYCERPATEVDHVPPLSRHFHRERSGCCTLVPSCASCARKQGGQLAGRYNVKSNAGRAAMPRPALPVADDPPGFDVDSSVWDVPWLTAFREIPEDAWWPRLMTVPHPDAVGSYGPRLVEWARVERGVDLYWWQQLVAARLLEHDRAGRLVWRDAFLSVARQSGKSTFLSILADWRSEAGWLFGEPQLVLHTADTLRHVLDVWQLALTRADIEGFTVRKAQGSERISKHDGGAWIPRSHAGVVGSSASLAIADEAQGIALRIITENLSPTLVERQQAQMLLVSTSHSKCTDLMPTYRLQGTGELDQPGRMLMLEWSADPELELGDPVAARQASPHWSRNRELDIGEAIARALATPPGHEMRVAVDAQWYNRWPSLASRGNGEPLLGDGVWAGCTGTIAATQPGWVGLEDNWGHGAAVAFVAGDGDRYEVDAITCETWADALVWARKFLEASPGSRLVYGASLHTSMPVDMPGRMQRAGGNELRRGLSVFRSLVADGRVVHDRTPELDTQVVAARIRPAADGMQLAHDGRKDALKAAVWALYFAQRPPAAPTIH